MHELLKRWVSVVVACALAFLLAQQTTAQPEQVGTTQGKVGTAQSQSGSAQSPAGTARSQFGVPPELRKRKLLVATMDGPPWSMKDEDGYWTGMTVELWREIARTLELTYEFKEYDIAELQTAVETGAVDLSVAGLAITAEREKRFDFTDPYFVMSQSVAVSADQQPNLFQIITSTLTTSDVFKLLLVTFVITLIGALILWLSEHKGQSEHYSGRDTKSFARATYWSIMVLSNREPVVPNTPFARIFEIFWVLVGIVLISLFTASAASLFTTRQLQTLVIGTEDLHRVKVGTVEGCAAQKILDHREIKYVAFDEPKELIQALIKHRVDAAVMAGATSSYYSKLFDNKVVVLRDSLRQDFAAIALPNGSPLRKPINRAMLELLDTKRWKKKISEYEI